MIIFAPTLQTQAKIQTPLSHRDTRLRVRVCVCGGGVGRWSGRGVEHGWVGC